MKFAGIPLLLAMLTAPLWGQQAPASSASATAPDAGAGEVATLKAQLAQLQARFDDFGGLSRYAAEDAALAPPAPGVQRVVFFGDSITDAWGRLPDTGTFFPGKPYINRGISGQTTEQMLIRFQQDVVHLKPAAVLILAGTNDIAGNTGPETAETIENDFVSMTEIAHASGIKVILASITPAGAYPWKPGIDPVAEIRAINTWLSDFCTLHGYTYLNYYDAMTTPEGAMQAGISKDGVHPNTRGYAIMAPLAEKAIAQALAK